MITLGRIDSHLPSTTFCWLPPDSVTAGVSTEGALMFRLRRCSSATFCSRLPMKDGKPQFVGKVGKEFTVEQGQQCAALCLYNVLAHLRNACGGTLDNVRQCLRLGVFVNAPEDFTEHPKVANGASDLMVGIFGPSGHHARAAVGVSGLPFGVAVEVEAMFEIE